MRKVLITFFFLFLISIPIGLLTGINSSFKLIEQRRLAELPSISLSRILDKEFYTEFEKYFNDHFAFRGPLIKSKNWLDFYIFKSSPSKKVHIGRDGWFFFEETLDDYMLEDCDQKQKIRALASGLRNMERMLSNQGRLFIFIVAPNKSTIYPEYVKISRQKKSCSKSPYNLLLEAFEEFPVSGFIRLDKLFMEAKKDAQIYSKTGTHWNYIGDSIVAELILKYIEQTSEANRAGAAGPDEWKKYMPEIETKETLRIGDLSKMMSLEINEPVESIKKITFRNETNTKVLAPLIKNDTRRHFSSTSKPHPGESLLPSTIIFRDSFMIGPLRILKGSFEYLHVLWTYNMLTDEGKDDLDTSRIVILEIVERNLNHIY